MAGLSSLDDWTCDMERDKWWIQSKWAIGWQGVAWRQALIYTAGMLETDHSEGITSLPSSWKIHRKATRSALLSFCVSSSFTFPSSAVEKVMSVLYWRAMCVFETLKQPHRYWLAANLGVNKRQLQLEGFQGFIMQSKQGISSEMWTHWQSRFGDPELSDRGA